MNVCRWVVCQPAGVHDILDTGAVKEDMNT